MDKKEEFDIEEFKKISKEFEDICENKHLDTTDYIGELTMEIEKFDKTEKLSSMVPIFVYGTLKLGFENSYFLATSKYLDDATTVEKYAMYPSVSNQFPFMIKSQKINNIKGEVFIVYSKDVLDSIDNLENYPSLYIKEDIEVILSDGNKMKVLTYFKNESNYEDAINMNEESIEEWF